MAKWLVKYWPALFSGGLSAVLSLSFAAELQLCEMQVADHFVEARGAITPPRDVVIVAIDDFSLQQAANSDMSNDPNLHGLGQWPWPRRYYGGLIERLMDAGATIIGLDLVFDTPSSHGSHDDARFADVISKYSSRIVLSSYALESQGSVAGVSIRRPYSQLLRSHDSDRIGIINAIPDADGSIRRRPSDYLSRLFSLGHRETSRSLADAVYEIYRREVPNRLATSYPPDITHMLRYYGPPRTIPTYSIWNVLEENSYAKLKELQAFKNKIVFVGPTARTMQDLHNTAFSGAEGMPGVEIHATELSNRLDGRSIYQISTNPQWSVFLGIIVFFFAMLLERVDRPLARLGWTFAFALLLAGISFLLVVEVGAGIEISTLGVGIILGGLFSTSQATATLQVNRIRLRRSLERYLSPAVASEVIRRDEREGGILAGKSAQVVIMLTDIMGFTAYTQSMSSQGRAKEAVSRLNKYFEAIINNAHKHGGTVDKFIGDSALIVFGAPINRGAQAEAAAAVRCATEICETLDLLNHAWCEEGLEPWRHIVAMTFGDVVCGNVGSDRRMDYTVIGDAVNAASRLEAIAKQQNVEILMNKPLADLCLNDNRVHFLGHVQLRGQGSTAIFSLIRQGANA